jgi:hypothetical protein
MSVAYPERKAIEFFWPKLSTGAVVVVDDYVARIRPQAQAIDEFARSVGVRFCRCPPDKVSLSNLDVRKNHHINFNLRME